MDELTFRKRVYANPAEPGQDVLDSAQQNPLYGKILDQARHMDGEVSRLLQAVPVPDGLVERLLSLPEQSADESPAPTTTAQASGFFHYYALAATVVLAIGLVFNFAWGDKPSAAEIAMGREVITHLYHENAELAAISQGTLDAQFGIPAINEVMRHAGTNLAGGEYLQEMPVRYANPCLILPEYQSAHLILQTREGPLNVIVINNSPVSREFSVRDDRFSGVVIPMPRGNLFLVGESSQNPGQYRELFTQQVDWAI